MSIQLINTGTSANAGNGDSIRTAFTKVNENFKIVQSFLGTTGSSITEAVEDTVELMFVHDKHTGIVATYDDNSGTIALSITKPVPNFTVTGILTVGPTVVSTGINFVNTAGSSIMALSQTGTVTIPGPISVGPQIRTTSNLSFGGANSLDFYASSQFVSFDISNPALSLNLDDTITVNSNLYIDKDTFYVNNIPLQVSPTGELFINGISTADTLISGDYRATLTNQGNLILPGSHGINYVQAVASGVVAINSGTVFSAANPFSPSVEGSFQFDGTSHVNFEGNRGIFDLFTSTNFTIEWYQLHQVPEGTVGQVFYFGADGFPPIIESSVSYDGVISNILLSYGTEFFSSELTDTGVWDHVAIVRQGSNLTVYINGQGTTSSINPLFLGDMPTRLTLGAISAENFYFQQFTGNITNFRAVASAVYTSNFTPSTTPLTVLSDTKFLYLASSSGTLLTDSADAIARQLESMAFTVGGTFLSLDTEGQLVLSQNGSYDYRDLAGTTLRIDTDKPNYTQIYVKNHNSSTTATSDLMIFNDQGNGNTKYIDIGINSSNYNEGPFELHTPGSGYLFTKDVDLVIGTEGLGTKLVFHAGGSDVTDAAGELNAFFWRFNRSVQTIVGTPGPLNFTVKNTLNNSAAQAVYQAMNNADEYLQMGINSTNAGAAYGAIGPRDGFVHIDGSTATLHIGGAGDVVFWSEEATAGYLNGTTATLVMSRADRSSTFGGHVLPASDLTYDLGSSSTQWRSLWVGTSTIYIGGVPISVNTASNTLVVGATPGTTSTTATNLATESFVIDYVSQNGGGGGAGPVQPYLQLTNTPFIIQTATLSEPVTITAANAGSNAQFTVVIGEGPTIDSVTVTSAGTGYSESQRYRIWSYDIGGPNDASSIDFTVDTVGENGEILTINNVGFVGTATNTPGTYTNAGAQLRASVFDAIGPGLTLTRDVNQGIYNSALEAEYDNNTYLSPLGTEWNNDGWGTLLGLGQRTYTTWRQALNNQVGNEILASELVMHDIANDKYYKFDFTAWNGNNGGYSYTRTEVTDPNYFVKTDNGSEVDIFVEDDGQGAGIGITRAGNNGIYNPYREEGWASSVSPSGTLWNIDGWDDLSDLTTRTYTNFYEAFGNGGLGNKVPGSKTIMYIPEIEKYYAIQWLSWTQGGQGGGFSYVRYEIDQTKLNEGIKFTDGTVLKSAEGVGRVKSTAPGSRRIEEVTGYNEVTVTSRTTTVLTALASRSQTNSTQVWVDITTTDIDDVIENPQNYNNAYGFQFSTDNTTWYNYDFGYSSDGNERGFDIWPNQVTYASGDTIYFRYFTGGESAVWWNSADLPGGSGNFRGAVIDYHAWTGESTIIGTIHIVDDSGEEHISHQEVQSGTTDGENDDLWLVTNEGQIRYRRIDGESKTLKIHWTAKVFYGSEFYD